MYKDLFDGFQIYFDRVRTKKRKTNVLHLFRSLDRPLQLLCFSPTQYRLSFVNYVVDLNFIIFIILGTSIHSIISTGARTGDVMCISYCCIPNTVENIHLKHKDLNRV